jgi:predicted nucleotidyltransferase
MALFGSVARNEQGEQSDIDVAYEGEANILLRSRMKRELEAVFGCQVDIVRLRTSLHNTTFEESIKKDLIYV